jgi:hypothetical protein
MEPLLRNYFFLLAVLAAGLAVLVVFLAAGAALAAFFAMESNS